MSWKKESHSIVQTGTTDTSNFFYEIENLVKPEKIINGWLQDNGNLGSSDTAQVLDYTEVLPNTVYSANFVNAVHCYDENKKFIIKLLPQKHNNAFYYGDRQFTIPSNGKYVRVNITGRQNMIFILGDRLPMNNIYNANTHPVVGMDKDKKYLTLKSKDQQDAQSLSTQLHVLNGKKINWLGDSITMGKYFIPDPINGGEKHVKLFHELMAERLNILCRNYGTGGTGIVSPNPPYGNYIDRAPEMDDDADIIVVFGGTNDQNIPLGTFGNGDKTTVYGGTQELITVLKNKYPDKLIVFMINFIVNQQKAREINQAIREVCDYNIIPYIELSKTVLGKRKGSMGETGDTRVDEKYFYRQDGVHPNDEGNVVLARFITRELSDILMFQ